MSTLVVVILFGCAIGIVLALITISLKKVTGRVLEQYRDRLEDANSIVNQRRPPDSWMEPFRQRMEGSASGDVTTERIGEQAKKDCLKRLKSLIKFMEKGQFYDNERTRENVLESLKSEYGRWAACDGIELLLDEGGED